MSYSILRVYNIVYTNFFEKFLNNLNLNNKNYSEISKLFFNQKVAYSDSFSRAMNNLNNKCEEVIYNFKFLQNLWDPSDTKKTSLEIFFRQLEEFKPDVLFFQGAPPLSAKELQYVRKNFQFIKKVIVHCGFQIDYNFLENIDILMLASPHLFDLYRGKIKNINLVYHYFDEDILNHIKKKNKEDFLIFCGKTGNNQNQDHHSRYHLLDRICKDFDIKCYSQEISKKENKRLSKYNLINLFFKKVTQKEIFLHDKYAEKIFNPVFGIEMYEKILSSYAVLNSHVDLNKIPINFSANMRLFETTGVGTAIFTEDSKNINELFNKNQLIVYKNYEDLINKIKYYKSNLDELIQIGKNGQDQTLKFHSSKVRINEINQIIMNNL